MSSELNNGGENGGLHHYPPTAKIDPAAALLPTSNNHQQEKQDTPKSEICASRTSSEPPNYFGDVYSSSPEDDETPLNLAAEAEDQFLEITVCEPHKVGEGISSYMAYKVTTKTNMKLFRCQHFSSTRRFSDFLGESLSKVPFPELFKTNRIFQDFMRNSQRNMDQRVVSSLQLLRKVSLERQK